MEKKRKNMDWFKKHGDSVATISVVVGAALYMSTSLSSLHIEIANTRLEMEKRFSVIEKDMAVIKTVLVMKEVLPKELATVVIEEKK